MYPILLNITGRTCVVIGGGKVAERKVRGLLEAGAKVRLISPEVTRVLAGLAGKGMVDWQQRVYSKGDLDGAYLVFAATDNRAVQDMISGEAEQKGILLNVADEPERCSFQVPASVRRGDLILSVSTGGRSPAVAAHIRQQLEHEFGPEYDILLQIMSQIRRQTGSGDDLLTQPDRKKIYKKILHDDIIEWIRTGQAAQLRRHLKTILGPEHVPDIKLPKLDT